MRIQALFICIFLCSNAHAQKDSVPARSRFQMGITPRFSEAITFDFLYTIPEKSIVQLELGTIFVLTIPVQPSDLFYDLETFDSVGKAYTARFSYFTKFRSSYYFGVEGIYRSAEIQEQLRYRSTDYNSYGYVTRAHFQAYGFQGGIAYYKEIGKQKRGYVFCRGMAGIKNCQLYGDSSTLIVTDNYSGSTDPPQFNMNRYNYWKPNLNLVAGIGFTLYDAKRKKK